MPVGWLRSIPTDDLPDDLYPGEESKYAVRWDQPALRGPSILISVINPAPEKLAAWLERAASGLLTDCDATDPVEVPVPGTTGERRSATCPGDLATEIVLLNANRDFIYSFQSSATGDAAAAREILDHLIETFEVIGPT